MTGGGKINRKSISILLLLLTIALPLNVGAISAAATNQTNIDQNLNTISSTNLEQKNTTQTVNKSVTNIENQKSVSKNTSTQNYAAAGTVKTVSTTPVLSLTLNNIYSAATKIQNYVKTYHRLPNYLTISGVKITMPQMLFIFTAGLIKTNSGSKIPVKVISIKSPSTNASETVTGGNLTKTQYNALSVNVYNYIIKYKTAIPNAKTSLGKIRYESLIFMYSKILSFYGTNKRLPNYVAVVPLIPVVKSATVINGTPVIPSALIPYTKATTNCQADSTEIKALAAAITSGIKSPLDRAVAIFNWVRDNISYSFYYNTRKGALGTLSSRSANCVDTAHLLIALERAAGNPAKYEHVTAQFSSGTWYGHVIALVYVNGAWYKADGTSSRNQFGVVNNWNTNTATVHGTYLTLPF
jgi:transglutaminase-like putative cysteine protease